MVADDDKLTDAVAFLDSSRGIGEYDGADAEGSEDAYGQGYLERGIALVIVDTALHDQDGNSGEQAGNDAAGVAGDGGLREVGNFGVRHGNCFRNSVCDGSEARAEDNADARREGAEFELQERRGFSDLIVVGHELPSAMSLFCDSTCCG